MLELKYIDDYHLARGNTAYTEKDEHLKEHAWRLAETWRRAYHPVRSVLTEAETETLWEAIAILTAEMMDPPSYRQGRTIKSLKEAGDGIGSIETVYEEGDPYPFPIVAALLAPLAPQKASTGSVHFSRMRP